MPTRPKKAKTAPLVSLCCPLCRILWLYAHPPLFVNCVWNSGYVMLNTMFPLVAILHIATVTCDVIYSWRNPSRDNFSLRWLVAFYWPLFWRDVRLTWVKTGVLADHYSAFECCQISSWLINQLGVTNKHLTVFQRICLVYHAHE